MTIWTPRLAETGPRYRAIAEAILSLTNERLGGETLTQVLDRLEAAMDSDGLAALTGPPRGDLARARRFELAAAINRLRSAAFKV